MPDTPIFTKTQYAKKLFNTFCPRFLRALSPKRRREAEHWKNQDFGDIHGFDQYTIPHERIPLLVAEIERLVQKESSILDLGCNVGLYLKNLRDAGFTSLAGVDISKNAIDFGRKEYHFDTVSLMPGSFEEILPTLVHEKKSYNLIYSMGATIELIHPSFDVIGHICALSNRYVVLIISEWGHTYPRFYEYEFNRQGFLLVKAIRPWDGKPVISDPLEISSLLVFERVRGR
ncbi:MAG: class I SAM-dependent methyltransferase [Deltaproteobacteria bacterium]|nr:class I SAM-dependent methyltransferase [Deltaproteobacteria bacterium]